MQKYTYEQAVVICKNHGYKLLDNTYINARTSMKIKNKDGFLFYMALGNIMGKTNPRIADSRNPYSIHNINLWIKVKEKPFKLLSTEYKNKDAYLKWKCDKCDYQWDATWHSIYFNNRGCPRCGGSLPHTYENVKNDIESCGYKLLDNMYKNVDTRFTIQDNDGYLYYTNYALFKRCKSFDKFSKTNIHTIHNINLWIKLNNKPFTLLSKKYVNNITDLKFKCDICGEIFYNAWVYIYDNYGCNLCTTSRGELKVKQFLDFYSMEYQRQYIFKDCKNIRNLRFDFYVNGVCIEYNGIQHYEPVEQFGGVKAFKYTQKRDQIKRDYCRSKNIKLIEIPYWDFDNIESILTQELNLLKAGDKI